MGRADELLDALSEDSFSTFATKPHIVVDIDRIITVPADLKRIAVQYDHNIETVTFDCPRYWDDLDMSTMAVYVNYKRPDGVLGSYLADNIVIDETDSSIMHFDWTISKNVTLSSGTLMFLVCIRNTNVDGDPVNHWNSELNTEMYISKGLECDDDLEELYPDIITQLLLRMDNVEAGVSPTVEITPIEGGTHLKLTDIYGPKEFDILNGEKGDAFTYDDFTPEQLAALKGEKGDKLTFSDLTEEERASLRGPKGDTGSGLKVLGYYDSVSSLSAAVLSPSVGDAYGVGSAAPYDIYIYDSTNGWVNNGPLQGAKGDDYVLTDADKQEIATAASALVPPELFFAKYGATTSAEIDSAYAAGKVVVCSINDRIYILGTRFSSTKHSFHSPVHDSIWSIVVENDTWGSLTHETFASENHASTHATDGSDPITPEVIGAMPSMKRTFIYDGINSIKKLTTAGWYRILKHNSPDDKAFLINIGHQYTDTGPENMLFFVCTMLSCPSIVVLSHSNNSSRPTIIFYKKIRITKDSNYTYIDFYRAQDGDECIPRVSIIEFITDATVVQNKKSEPLDVLPVDEAPDGETILLMQNVSVIPSGNVLTDATIADAVGHPVRFISWTADDMGG